MADKLPKFKKYKTNDKKRSLRDYRKNHKGNDKRGFLKEDENKGNNNE